VADLCPNTPHSPPCPIGLGNRAAVPGLQPTLNFDFPVGLPTPRGFAHAVGSFLLLTVWRPRTARENIAPGLRVMVDLLTKSQR
jgi:hypothetical protein